MISTSIMHGQMENKSLTCQLQLHHRQGCIGNKNEKIIEEL